MIQGTGAQLQTAGDVWRQMALALVVPRKANGAQACEALVNRMEEGSKRMLFREQESSAPASAAQIKTPAPLPGSLAWKESLCAYDAD